MGAKDKAREMYDKFQGHSESFYEKEHTKECVYIAIEEIENALYGINKLYNNMGEIGILIKYWQNVRKELDSF